MICFSVGWVQCCPEWSWKQAGGGGLHSHLVWPLPIYWSKVCSKSHLKTLNGRQWYKTKSKTKVKSCLLGISSSFKYKHFLLQKLSEANEYKNVVFLKVDVDEAAVSVSTYFTAFQQMKCARCNRLKRSVRAWWLGGFDSLLFLQDVSSSCGISCMPTFHFYKNGKKVRLDTQQT